VSSKNYFKKLQKTKNWLKH